MYFLTETTIGSTSSSIFFFLNGGRLLDVWFLSFVSTARSSRGRRFAFHFVAGYPPPLDSIIAYESIDVNADQERSFIQHVPLRRVKQICTPSPFSQLTKATFANAPRLVGFDELHIRHRCELLHIGTDRIRCFDIGILRYLQAYCRRHSH